MGITDELSLPVGPGIHGGGGGDTFSFFVYRLVLISFNHVVTLKMGTIVCVCVCNLIITDKVGCKQNKRIIGRPYVKICIIASVTWSRKLPCLGLDAINSPWWG